MKYSILLSVIVCIIILTPLPSCDPGISTTYIPVPFNTSTTTIIVESPDDIIDTPGGSAYRANVHQEGTENPWTSIDAVEVLLGTGSDAVYVRYRNYVVTKTGEIRNNIFTVRKNDGLFENQNVGTITLSVAGTPNLNLSQKPGGALLGTLTTILVIEIPKDTSPGIYTFNIGINILGKDYGTIPCTVEVTL